MARVSRVIELQRAGAHDRDGSGLFLRMRTGSEAGNGYAWPVLRPGDALAHTFDFLHGVEIKCDSDSGNTSEQMGGAQNATLCSRHSLVVWFHESASHCTEGADVEAQADLLCRSASMGVPAGQARFAEL
mmetsp:Transcript_56491/g.126191  ORF Transcript_56491/g.126191 Transcript_56491/m.126191 type:complete len:130 (+) Transcript_56491:728-1117(+)